MNRGSVLIVDDDESMCLVLKQGLLLRGFDASFCNDPRSVLLALQERTYHAVLVDMNMPHIPGLALCERIHAFLPNLPVIVITAFGNMDSAIAAIRAGAYDFVTKPFELDAIALSLDRAVAHHLLQQEVKNLRIAVSKQNTFNTLIGNSSAMRSMMHILERASQSEASVLITGETGTGKECVAKELHKSSARVEGPFVAINCAAMPDTLLESELFGHVKGSFTDAKNDRKGLLESAAGGTLFLDEIGDMPLHVQPKLLRALQERTIRPTGCNQEIPIDVRLITATHRDLSQAVEKNLFRQDLLYRINVIQLHLPPLRERANDALLLAQHFLTQFSERYRKSIQGITGPAALKLLHYAWPGNVRELQNCIERAVILASHDQITLEDLPDTLRNFTESSSHKPPLLPALTESIVPLLEMEKRYVQHVLQLLCGNKTLAAKLLQVDRKTLLRKI